MKATTLLKRQHREVEGLFAAAKKATAPTKRRAVLDEIADKLRGHMMIEEQIFYPAVAAQSERKKMLELIPEAYEEHHVVKLVLGELPSVDPADKRFVAKVTVLSELVEHHVEEEEKEMFPAVEKDLGDDVLTELGQRMQAALDSDSYAEAVTEADEQGLDDDEDEDDDGGTGDDDEEVEAPRREPPRREPTRRAAR